MTDSHREDDTSADNDELRLPPTRTVILLLATLADTTWRLFGPPLIGLGIGYWLDNTNATTPAYMLGLVIAGFILSVILIYLQIKKINRSSPTS